MARIVSALDFDLSSVQIISPGIRIWLPGGADLTAHYYYSSSDSASTDESHAGVSFIATGRPADRVRLSGGYIRGFEGLTFITADVLQSPDTNIVRGSVRSDVRPMTSLGASFEHQWRPLDARVATILLTLTQRF